jgi:signal transduction histidine kinase
MQQFLSFTQTKTMNTSQRNINRKVTKLRNYSSSAGLSAPLPPPVIVQKKWVQFAPALAHEVRNPLSNINLAVEMLQSMMQDEEQKLYLDIILRASGRVNDLVNDLLVYHQDTLVKPEKSSVQQLLNEVLFMTADRLMLKNIKVRKDYTTLECNIMAERQKIKIALTNIIINAIDAMPPENGELKLVVRLLNGKCIIEIEDNGIGISKDNLQHIFKPYFTKKTNGMGLGLSTTMETLLSNNARVAVQSEEGRGTRFILSFNDLRYGKYVYDKPVLTVV